MLTRRFWAILNLRAAPSWPNRDWTKRKAETREKKDEWESEWECKWRESVIMWRMNEKKKCVKEPRYAKPAVRRECEPCTVGAKPAIRLHLLNFKSNYVKWENEFCFGTKLNDNVVISNHPCWTKICSVTTQFFLCVCDVAMHGTEFVSTVEKRMKTIYFTF